jgi:ubiquinone/menaquinone biosynthesis C-methylase UbiE
MPDFSHDSEFYWGELERETMQAILSSDTPVEEQLLGLLATEHAELEEYLTHYALGRLRAGWKFVTGLPRGGRALDFGCGWGSLALSLGESIDEIVVSDVVPERVAMVRRRAIERGLTSFSGCVSSGWPRLPFPDAHFDLVVLNGVLEWIPSSIPGHPQRIQQKFLEETHRILKPSGQLYIGIENRFGALYFLGKREEHTKLRFISLLPRVLAAVYHRMAFSTEFKTYTYGRGALGRMLKNAGYAETKFYSPYPDYREFCKLVDPDDSVWMAHAFRPSSTRGRLAFELCKRTWILKTVSPSFGVVASVSSGTESLLQRLTSDLISSDVLPADVRVAGYDVSATATVHVTLKSHDDQWLLALPLDERAAVRLRLDVKNRGLVRKRLSGTEVVGSIAEVASDKSDGVLFKLETLCKGRNAREVVGIEGSQIDTLCLAWLAEYHGTVIGERLPFTVSPIMEQHRDAFVRSLGSKTCRRYKACLHKLTGSELRQVFTHGDFHRGNVFVHEGAIERVVDWDCCVSGGLPLWDALNFFCMDFLEDGCEWHEAFKQSVLRVLESDPEQESPSYCAGLGLDEADIRAAVLTYPMLQFSVKAELGDQRAEVITRDLAQVMEWAMERLSS